MASACVLLVIYTGASAATESGSVTGIDLISADNATNSLANRNSNPVSTCSFSYEKYLRLKIGTAGSPDNSISNFKVWGDGACETSTDLNWGLTTSPSTPINTESTIATSTFSTYTSNSASKLAWDTGSYAANSCPIAKYLCLQLEVLTAASAGNWSIWPLSTARLIANPFKLGEHPDRATPSQARKGRCRDWTEGLLFIEKKAQSELVGDSES